MTEDNTNHKLLKSIAYILAVVLIVGFIGVGMAVLGGLHKKDDDAPKYHTAKKSKSWQCEGGKMELDLDSDIYSVEMGKYRLILLTKAKGKKPQKIIVIDYCNNKVISEIVVK